MILLFAAGASAANELVRGLVVDRNDKTLWLGLASPVNKDTVFNVSLVPGSEVLARATVINCTPDEPFVAQARFKVLIPEAFVPVGAYVEIAGNAVPDMDEPDGYESPVPSRESAGRLSFRVAAFFPSDSGLSDETSSAWPTFQIGYQICRREGMSAEIALAYYGQDGEFVEGAVSGRREFRAVPLTFDVRFPISGSKRSGWVARAGVGAYSIRDERTVGGVQTSRDVTTFGWQAGFGYVSSRGYSAELHYTDVSSTDLQGVGFSLGTRF
jgi:hypothetical protein